MRSEAKWIVVLSVVGAIVLGGVLIAAAKSKKSTEVRIEPVAYRDLVASVTASGQVVPHTKVDVSTDISGRIISLPVKEGDMVKKGQLLLQIDPALYQAQLEHDKAALAGARAAAVQSNASLSQAQHNYDRSAEIKAKNPALISVEQLEQLKTALDVAKATKEAADFQVEQAQASLQNSQSALDKTTVLAPMSGKVTRLDVENGETAIQGTLNKDAATLLTISDMNYLETRVKVDETDVSHIQVGDSAQIQLDAFPDTTFVGRVTKIANSSVKAAGTANTTSTDQAVDYEVTIKLLNPPVDTRPDFSATAKVVTDTRNHVLSIPIIALTVRENESLPSNDSAVTIGRAQPTKQVGKRDEEGVFVVGNDNKVTFRPVKVGIAGDKYFEVVNGLQANERIVGGTYQAIRELKDGALVHEPKPDKKKPDQKPVTQTAQAKP
ncbi:MAG TPA: efflux RND transporter periplasmic adaptor subunit [Gemmatimonadaceae bacterium]|jgi:HlyD family secretion protein|nr:efflux RND transporter periplasmic adaptor subunit [Gemmatimonadaceae bacterium]